MKFKLRQLGDAETVSLPTANGLADGAHRHLENALNEQRRAMHDSSLNEYYQVVRPWFDRAYAATSLRSKLRGIMLPEQPPLLVINKMPLDTVLGPTPCRGETTDDEAFVLKSALRWCAEQAGLYIQTYTTIAGGRAFHDVNPVLNTAKPLSSKGGDRTLGDHSDSAADAARPDALILGCARTDRQRRSRTYYSSANDAAAYLSDAELEQLSQRRYYLKVPQIHDMAPAIDRWRGPLALLTGKRGQRGIRFNAAGVKGTRDEDDLVINALVDALGRARVEISLESGQVLIFSNRAGTHGRNAFQPTFGPDDRWLIRAYLTADPWARRAALADGRIGVVE